MSTTYSPTAHESRPHVRAWLLLFAGVAAVLASAFLAGAAASTGAAPTWVNTGPEGGHLAIAIHPRSPQVVYASTFYGLFRSGDGGATWQRRPAPEPWLSQVALDPADPQTLYALASGALYRTTNAGASWVQLPRPSADVHFNPILVAVSPSSPRTIYLVSAALGVRVFSSADAGRSWVQAGRIKLGGRSPAAILVDPRSPSTVYVWVRVQGIFRSEDGGKTWTRASDGLPIGKLSSVAVNATQSGVLYAGSERGEVFRSLDAGRTWRAVARGLDGAVTGIIVSAADGAVYAGTSPPYRTDGVDVGGGTVYRSADGRAPWSERSYGLTGWNVRALAAHPGRPGTVLVATEHGIFGTRNGGASWGERVRGLVASSPTGLAVDPLTAGTVFATLERGVAVSRDGGRTWGTALDLRRERADVGPLLAVPGAPATVYAVKGSHDGSKPRSILLASRDAGRTWTKVGPLPHSGESVNWTTALVGDPGDANTLYLVSRGIFKSVDAGRTWTRIYSAVNRPLASAVAVDPFDSKLLYALIRGRLRMSENGGHTWRELPGIPQAGIWQFALDPHRRGTVYAVTGGYVSLVYVSKDRGGTWSMLGKPPGDTLTLLVDPVRPGVLYVGTTRGVYLKRPGTTTWQRVGLAGRHVRWLATDAKGRRLYAGIEGGGVAATRLPLPTAGIRRPVSAHNSAKAGTPSASPTAGLIAFTRSDGVYVMEADGSGVRLLWRGARAVTDLAWSPDGRQLAVGTWGGGVRVMNADGSGVVRIASVLARSLSWSPDGRRIAFTRWYKSVGPDIWVMDAEGSHMRRLARTQAWESAVAWSPAGGRFAFTTGSWCQHVYVMNTNGRNLHRLTPDGCNGVGSVDWSPDGRRIVFAQAGGIWVMDAGGRSRVRLRANGDDPVWSPDGRRIAFVRRLDPKREASTEIFVISADGTGAKRLTHDRIAEAGLAWQPVALARD